MGAGDKGYAARISHKSGTADAPITIKAQGGPVILDNSDDASSGAVHSLRVQNSKHWVIEGVGFTGAVQNSKGAWSIGAVVEHSSNITLKDCAFFGNDGPGLRISGRSRDNKVVNCDSYDNFDPKESPPGGNADGFQFGDIPKGYNGNSITGSRSWNNSDDGFDLWDVDSPVLLKGNTAFANGYIPGTDGEASQGDGQGFKLGRSRLPVEHEVRDNVAYDNKLSGFDSNQSKGPLKLIGNLAFNNGERNYYIDADGEVPGGKSHVLRDNESYGSGRGDYIGGGSIESGNTWDGDISDFGGLAREKALPLWGTEAGDHLLGYDSAEDSIYGFGGADVLRGRAGDDRLRGGTGSDQLYGGLGDDRLGGGSGADSLKGGQGSDVLNGGKGGDILRGSKGADVLDGGAGADVMLGGRGADEFRFSKASETGKDGVADRVVGFSSAQGDLIDVSRIDASVVDGGSQSFEFIGRDGFNGVAGELRFNADAGFVEGDTDGDGRADFRIELDGISNMTADDFIL
jgi:Ca2+-binding RTX toxin-like protein